VREQIVTEIKDNLSLNIFSAKDIELSKETYIQTNNSVAVVANRYDGIDFPGDECRLLFIEGLPKSINTQERFLMTRMGANTLFNERVQTRVLQAIGRCTRSLEDYSAVVVTGKELPDYLINKKRRCYFHPELQAELEFGVGQSKNSNLNDFEENLAIFLENGRSWEDANQMIVELRQEATQKDFPTISELKLSVKHEVKYQTALWQCDYEEALSQAESVLGVLTDKDLGGYRALWEYLAGSAAFLASSTRPEYKVKSSAHFLRAKNAAKSIPWLVRLSKLNLAVSDSSKDETDSLIMLQVEKIEGVLEELGTAHDRTFVERELKIIEGLNSEDFFEDAQKMLGEHIGFDAGKIEDSGSPDPWWQCGDLCLVFEDHANAKETSSLDIKKARQAASHPTWMKDHITSCQSNSVEILPVLITPVSTVYSGALTFLSGVSLWKLNDFRIWSTEALRIIRELRKTYIQPGDLVWRAEAAALIQGKCLDIVSLNRHLKSQQAKEILKEKPKNTSNEE